MSWVAASHFNGTAIREITHPLSLSTCVWPSGMSYSTMKCDLLFSWNFIVDFASSIWIHTFCFHFFLFCENILMPTKNAARRFVWKFKLKMENISDSKNEKQIDSPSIREIFANNFIILVPSTNGDPSSFILPIYLLSCRAPITCFCFALLLLFFVFHLPLFICYRCRLDIKNSRNVFIHFWARTTYTWHTLFICCFVWSFGI